MNQKVAVITGSSNGIGLETALILARNGYTTYATMRSPHKGTSIKAAVQNEMVTSSRVLYFHSHALTELFPCPSTSYSKTPTTLLIDDNFPPPVELVR